jgi:hypothetical protein
MTTDPELRGASDGLLEKLGLLHDLEMRKRLARPGTPQFIQLSRDVEAAAREVLAVSARQTDLAVETITSPEPSGRPIEAIEPPRDVASILAEWREAERRLGAAAPESDGFRQAAADVERLRTEYRRAFDAHRAPQ